MYGFAYMGTFRHVKSVNAAFSIIRNLYEKNYTQTMKKIT
jgi:hypothetical protein